MNSDSKYLKKAGIAEVPTYYFDRGTESLVFVDWEKKSVTAWKRKVWESVGFTLDGNRGLPEVPEVVMKTLIEGRAI